MNNSLFKKKTEWKSIYNLVHLFCFFLQYFLVCFLYRLYKTELIKKVTSELVSDIRETFFLSCIKKCIN